MRGANRAKHPPFEFQGRSFSDVRLLERSPGRIWSRAGRLSWSATMDGEPVKIIECADSRQAGFIERLSDQPEIAEHLPRIHLRSDNLLVVDWILGRQMSWKRAWRASRDADRLAALQAKLHATRLDATAEETGFDYIAFLVDRTRRFASVLPLRSVLERMEEIVSHGPATRRLHISHPDVTADNVVIERHTDRMVVIDNELIAQNNYYSIDLFNTVRSFESRMGPDRVRDYLEAYLASGGDVTPLATSPQFFGAVWHLRLIGSALQSGRIDEAMHHAAAAASDRPLPPSPVLAFVERAGTE